MTHDFIAVTIHVEIIIEFCTNDAIGAIVLLLKTVDRYYLFIYLGGFIRKSSKTRLTRTSTQED